MKKEKLVSVVLAIHVSMGLVKELLSSVPRGAGSVLSSWARVRSARVVFNKLSVELIKLIKASLILKRLSENMTIT